MLAAVDRQRRAGHEAGVVADQEKHTARDLIGKKVSMNTLGAHSEFVLREYLARNGLTPKEAEQVTFVVVPPISSEQSLRAGQVDVAALNGLLRDKALERGGLRLLFSDYQLYGSFNAGTYVFKEKFIKENPKTVARFVEGTARAIEWARTTPKDQVVARFVDIIQKRGRGEDPAAGHVEVQQADLRLELPGGRNCRVSV